MVHGNVGQFDLTREDMTRYIRYLVDVIGNEQKALYSYLEDRTNPYICLHGECQTLANWISILLEAYGESFTRWDMRLHFTVFGKRYSDLTKSERPKQFDDWGVRNVRGEGAYLHTLIEWDGLYWDANGGGTRQEKEEYYESMTYRLDGKRDRKRLLFNFIDWEEFKAYLDWPLTTDSLDYEWEWVDLGTHINYTVADYMMVDWMSNFDSSNPPRDNLGVFREFINHLRMDDFAAERIYFDDEYGGFIKGNPRANELPGEVLFPGEDERLAKIMSPEEYAELEQEVNLILSKNLPYNVESLSEDERIALHEDIIMKILNHEYIHQSIDDEVLEWAIENNKTKGDYYAAHEIMAYVDMALRESLGMRDFKLQLTSLVSQHPILTDNPELGDRIMDALTRTRKGQRFQIPAEIETLMRAFHVEDYEIIVVGGAVRDMLMGLVPKDYDLATNATPEEVEVVVSELEGYRTVTTPEAQMARGVLTTLVLPPSGEVIEVTTFRAELGYEDGTRRPVAVAADTFYEDSLRRDFTMNALGWRLNGTILDYHEGVDDIEFGQLVAVGDASERLEEDPLRILRAVRFASRYGLEIDEELGGAIETNLPQLLTLSPERIRRELDTILKSEEGVYDLFETGILETIIPEYKGIYWGERHYDELPVITSVRNYGQIDRELTPYEKGLGWKSEPWQPAVAYALLLQGRLTREEFNEQYRRGPISFSKAEADMIAELIELYPVALESEEPADIVAVVTSPYYAELMLMLEYTNRSDLVDYFTPYRSRYKGKPPKGYAMTVADEYGIEPGPALGERLSEITEAIILGDIEDWEEGLNYYAAETHEIPEFVYHATPGKNLDSIMEHGLEPRIGELSIHAFGKKRYEEKIGTPKVWATSQNKANIYASMIAPMSYLEDNAILKIKTEGLDFEFYGFEEFFTDNVVPPSHIKFMYRMDGDKSEEDPNWTVDQQIDYLHNKRGACPSIVDGERRCFDGRLCTYTEHAAEEVGTRERIAYAGVILDEDTSEQLLAHFETLIPESWTRYAHHMTVSLGKSIPNQADLGKEVTLTITAVGKSDDAIAVAVSGYPSRNAIPHITLAVPPGGKPFNSNKITDWHSVEPFEIQGQLQDVKTYVAEEIDTLHESLNYPLGFYSKSRVEDNWTDSNYRKYGIKWRDLYRDYPVWEAETFESESSQDWSRQYTWQPVPIEDFIEFRRLLYTPVQLEPQYQLDDILNLKTVYRGTRKPSSIREGMFGFFGSGEINEREQIPETVYFYTWERPYEPDEWRVHNSSYECACEECKKYAFNHINVSYINSGLIRSSEFRPEWEDTSEGSEIVRVLFIPHLPNEISVRSGFESRRYHSHLTRNNLNLEDYGFEPVIWSKGGYSKDNRGEFYSSPYNTNLRALEQRLSRGVRRTLNYPRFSSETVTKYSESFWGDAGSGVLVVARDTQRILLGLRSEDVNEPNTWGNFGGAIGVTDFGEPEEALPPEENALKEMAEEIGYTGAIEMIPSFTYRSPEFTYYNFIGVVDRESDVPLNQFNWEVSDLRWFTLDEVMSLSNLHFGVSALMRQEELVTLTAESESTIKLYPGGVVPVTYDASGQPYVTLYHATTMDNFEIIEATGLKPFTPGYYEKIDFETYDNVEGIYFATDLEQAQKWIGWKYRETICTDMEYLEEEGYEVSLVPNEIAGVVYAVDFPVSGKTRKGLEGLHPDSEVPKAWYATEAISRLEMDLVGFYSVPICLYGRRIEPSEIKELSEFEAKQIHERGFYVDAIPPQYYSQKPPSSEFLIKYPHIATPFTVARRKGRRYLPLQHILSPRDPFFSGYRGTFMAESVPMSDWSKLSPVELAGLTEFPSDDGHLDAWQMYISPSETREKYLEVLELAESEYSKMESEYREANGLKPRELIPWQDRKNLPFTWDEIYAKYFDFWYVPDCQYSLSGGGYHELSESIRESLGWDSLKNMAKERGIPFNDFIPFDQYRSYYPEERDSQWVENDIKWAKERGRDKIQVGSDLIIKALINEHLSLPLEKIFYCPLLAAAPLDAEIGTDAGKGAGLIAGWHRDAYANILASQGRITGSPVVFFKPKEEYL